MMAIPRPLTTLLAAAAAFALALPLPAQEPEASPGLPDAAWVGVFLPTFDSVAAAAGIPPLRGAALDPGYREVRVWIGGGTGYPQQLLRVRDDRGTVSGELIFHWPAGPPDPALGEREGETFHDLMLHSLRGSCDGFRERAGQGICRGILDGEPAWAATLREAEAAGLWTLPDESQLPRRGFTLDGWGITVELRDGSTYRAYQYSNPDRRPDPEAAAAVRIAEAFRTIRTHPPDRVRVFRGATTGVYRDAFLPCGGGEPLDFYSDLSGMAERAGIALGAPGRDSLHYVELEGSLYLEWVTRDWDSRFGRVLQPLRLLTVRPWTGAECPPEALGASPDGG